MQSCGFTLDSLSYHLSTSAGMVLCIESCIYKFGFTTLVSDNLDILMV